MGFLYKVKNYLPYQMYEIIKSYISNRYFFVEQHEEFTNLKPILAGVPQGSVLGPMLYLLYTADMPTTRLTTTATFADDTAILASHNNHERASHNLQQSLNKVQEWFKQWRIKANTNKLVHITFTNIKENCPPFTFIGHRLKLRDSIKYLGMHLDRRLNWRKYIFVKRKQLRLQFSKLYWIIGRNSQLSLNNYIYVLLLPFGA